MYELWKKYILRVETMFSGLLVVTRRLRSSQAVTVVPMARKAAAVGHQDEVAASEECSIEQAPTASVRVCFREILRTRRGALSYTSPREENMAGVVGGEDE